MEYNIDYKTGRIIYYVICSFLFIFGIFLMIYHIFDFKFASYLSFCSVNRIWHLYCPACGGTRSLDFLLHGQLISSFLANPLVLSMLLFFLSYFLPATYTFLIKRNGNIYYHFQKKFLIILILINVLYFVARNISLIFFQYDFIGENAQYFIK